MSHSAIDGLKMEDMARCENFSPDVRRTLAMCCTIRMVAENLKHARAHLRIARSSSLLISSCFVSKPI